MCQDENMNMSYNDTEDGLSHTRWSFWEPIKRKPEFPQQSWRSEPAWEELLGETEHYMGWSYGHPWKPGNVYLAMGDWEEVSCHAWHGGMELTGN